MTVEHKPDAGADGHVGKISLAETRTMFLQQDLDQTLSQVMEVALRLFGGEAVSVLMRAHGRIATTAATELAVHRCGDLEVDCGEGPSLDAIVQRRDSIVDDLRVEGRWRLWAPRAAHLGWRSLLSVHLSDQDTAGAVSLFSRQPAAFRAEDLPLAEVFAQHAALALFIGSERGSLLRAVETRTLIGQAQGIVMQAHHVDARRAFNVLRRYSSHANRKLRHIAEDVVRDRSLPADTTGGIAM